MSNYDVAVDNAIQKLLKYHEIRTELRQWEEKLYLKEHAMYDLHAIRYDKEGHGSSLTHDQLINLQSASKDYLIEQVERCKAEMKYINLILDNIEEEYHEMVQDRFVACMSSAEMEIKYNYSRKQIKRRIKKAVNNSIIIIQTCPHVPQ